MRYLPFGRSGLRVSELCLGALRFGGGEGGLDEAEGQAIFDAYVEAGGNFIDTASNYNEGRSEEALGPLIKGRRDDLVLSTKFALARREDPITASGASRKSLRVAVERSLRRLGTDYLDILYLHRWDFDTPADEVLRAMGDLIDRGMVDHIALSNTPAWIVARCDALAELHGWHRFAGMQIAYSLLDRTADREVAPMAEALNLGLAAWWPLHGGQLAGQHLSPDGAVDPAAALPARDRAIVQCAADIARETGLSIAQIALAWIRHRPVPIIPVAGADSVEQLKQNIAAMTLQLDEAHLQRLDEVSQVELGYPYGYFERASFRDMLTSYKGARMWRPSRRQR